MAFELPKPGVQWEHFTSEPAPPGAPTWMIRPFPGTTIPWEWNGRRRTLKEGFPTAFASLAEFEALVKHLINHPDFLLIYGRHQVQVLPEHLAVLADGRIQFTFTNLPDEPDATHPHVLGNLHRNVWVAEKPWTPIPKIYRWWLPTIKNTFTENIVQEHIETRSPARRSFGRTNASYVREILERYLPDAALRKIYLQLLADLIVLANDASPSSWGVTLHSQKMQLNVGNLCCLLFRQEHIKLFWEHQEGAEGPEKAGQAFDRVPLSRSYGWTPEIIQPWAEKLRPQIDALTLSFARKSPILWPPSQSAHSPGILRYLEEELGITLPNPHYPQSDRPTHFWRIGTREGAERIDRWPVMRDGGFVSIGWSGLGDIGEMIAGLDESEARAVLKRNLVPLGATEGNAPGYASQWYQFTAEMQVDDIVVAMDGQRMLGIGTIVGDYEYLPEDTEQSHHHAVRWEWIGDKIWPKHPGYLTTVSDFTNNLAATKFVQSHLSQTDDTLPLSTDQTDMPPPPLNTILYGPPGTGKTYETARRAVEIIEGSASPTDRKELMARYRQLQREGRIGFVTFHQSYAYEDFIEGIRPVMDEEEGDGSPRYRVVDGIFKTLAINALGDMLEAETPPVSGTLSSSFRELWEALQTQIAEKSDATYPGLTDASEFSLKVTKSGSINGQNIKSTAGLLFTNQAQMRQVWEMYAAKEQKITTTQAVAVLGKNINASLIAAVYLALKNLEETPLPEIPRSTPSREEKARNYLSQGETSLYEPQESSTRYVLIVDEINRGNISKILGELITLLEDDKRIGEDNELTVTLPYSREPFAVPPNLYLIGTMNTADKSLALLDVALRRRFTFEELTPDFGVCSLRNDMQQVLEELNRRITLRKDRDHRIGHAFFMRVGSDAAAFDAVFRGKVLPLLQEYFFNDWDGVRYVLGERDNAPGFVVPMEGWQDKGVRNRWQWYTDAGKVQEFSPLTQLQANYGNDQAS